MTDAIWWQLFYAIGKKYGWLRVYAHDKEQARKLGIMQIRYVNHSRALVRVISIKKVKDKKA